MPILLSLILSITMPHVYVAISGSDSNGNGTKSNPWQSISYAVSKQPGSGPCTISVGPGHYVVNSTVELPPNVSLIGSGMDKTVIIASNTITGIVINLNSQSHANGDQTISDLTVDGNNRRATVGIHIVGRDGVTVCNTKIKSCQLMGLEAEAQSAGGKPLEPVKGIRIYNNSLINCSHQYKDWCTGALTIGGLSGADIYGNTIKEDSGYGIKFGNGYGGIYGCKIHDNVIDVPTAEPFWGSCLSIELWNMSKGTLVYGNKVNTMISLVNSETDDIPSGWPSVSVYANRIVSPNPDNAGAGIELACSHAKVFENYIEQFRWGVGLWANSHDNELFRNVIFNRTVNHSTYVAGFYLTPELNGGEIHGIKIYNNILDGLDTGIWMKGKQTKPVRDLFIANNLILHAAKQAFWVSEGQAYISNLKLLNNLVFDCHTEWSGRPESAQESGSLLEVDPRIKGSGLRPWPFYSPLSRSPLIGAGVEIRPEHGTKSNIGAWPEASSKGSAIKS